MTEHLIFKIGRCGHFNNKNHLSFIGVGNLDNETVEIDEIKYCYYQRDVLQMPISEVSIYEIEEL